MRLLPIVAAGFAAAACRSAPAATARAESGSLAPVRVWLTTGDQRHLLEPQTPIRWAAPPPSADQAVIEIDPSRPFQEMIGFGAAMTDASAHLLQKLPEQVRERALQDLFATANPQPDGAARDSGIGLSFVRVPMGASDFSTRHYS